MRVVLSHDRDISRVPRLAQSPQFCLFTIDIQSKMLRENKSWCSKAFYCFIFLSFSLFSQPGPRESSGAPTSPRPVVTGHPGPGTGAVGRKKRRRTPDGRLCVDVHMQAHASQYYLASQAPPGLRLNSLRPRLALTAARHVVPTGTMGTGAPLHTALSKETLSNRLQGTKDTTNSGAFSTRH